MTASQSAVEALSSDTGVWRGLGVRLPQPGGHPSKPGRGLLDIDVLSEWLATSPRHIRRLVAERRIPFVKVGHFIRFDPEDISLWIEEQKVRIEDDGVDRRA